MLTDLRKLRHVVEVAQAESFTRAAASLAITQSALTKSVADVERILGIKLFQRLPRGVTLTEAGRAFVVRARQILADTQNLMNAVEDHRTLEAGRLVVGVAPAAMQSLLVRPIALFAKQYPKLTIEIYEGPFERMAQSLVSGEIEVLLSLSTYLNSWPELPWATVGQLHYSFVGRKNHPAAAVPDLSQQELLTYPVILPPSTLPMSAEITQALQRAEAPVNSPRYICDYFPLAAEIVQQTDAISPVLSFKPLGARLRKEFHVFEDVLQLQPESIGLARSATRDAPPAVAAFIDLLTGTH